MHKGTKKYKEAERAAQERHNIPIDKAGRDHISRGSIDWERYRSAPLWDELERRKKSHEHNNQG